MTKSSHPDPNDPRPIGPSSAGGGGFGEGAGRYLNYALVVAAVLLFYGAQAGHLPAEIGSLAAAILMAEMLWFAHTKLKPKAHEAGEASARREVLRTADPFEADRACAVLEAEGVRAIVLNRHSSTLEPIGAMEGLRVFVHEAQYEEAMEILEAYREELAADDDDEIDDEEER
ncbi:DUF2007 domain-containing protein [bacterium]|nr:DUF2007 domain-containing protein [bacterium]